MSVFCVTLCALMFCFQLRLVSELPYVKGSVGSSWSRNKEVRMFTSRLEGPFMLSCVLCHPNANNNCFSSLTILLSEADIWPLPVF